MKFLFFVLKAIAAIVVIIIVCGAGPAYYAISRPFASVEVPIEYPGVTALFEAWSDFGGGQYWLVTSTSLGSAERKLWSNWGPATRANFYRTSDNRLVVLGGGGASEMVDLNNAIAPQEPRRSTGTKADSASWSYLGAVDYSWSGAGGYRFFPPSERKECFAMFGAGYSPYRHQYQAESRCP